jgi:hypothetical protein
MLQYWQQCSDIGYMLRSRPMIIFRRTFLTGCLAAAALPIGLQLAKAQVVRQDRRLFIAGLQASGERVLMISLETNLSPEGRSAADALNETMFGQVRREWGNVSNEELLQYTEPAQVIIVERMIQEKIIIVPEKYLSLAPPEGGDGKSEDLIDVVLDIVKDVFGIKDLDVKGVEKILEELGWRYFLSQVGQAIRASNPGAAAQIIRAALAKLAATPGILQTIEAVLGKQVTKDILIRVGARFVPLLGWPVLVAATLFAIAKHRQRLLAALEKSRKL